MNRETVLAAINKYGMLNMGDTVVIGLSGGADSVSLTSVLLSLKEELRLNLICAHVNHGIRGEEADGDERFCRNFCRDNGIEIKVLNADVPGQAKINSMSQEEYGRKIRYEFFASLAGENGKIATAHNLNDCVETLLFNLARGTSLKGACSIPPVRGNIIRPLIETPREEIEEFCRENSLEFVTDSTNFENEYSRNKIRNIVIPALKEINASAVPAISRYIAFSRQEEEALEFIEDEKYALCLSDSALCEESLMKLPVALQRRIIYRYLKERTSSDISAKHIEDILSLLGKNKAVNTAGGLKIRSKNGFLSVVSTQALPKPWKIGIEKKDAQIALPYGRAVVKIINIKDLQNFNKEYIDKCVDCDKISEKLCLRSRESGDKITLAKRGVTKSLKKLFIEDKIDADKRNRTAVLADGEEVVWVDGYGSSKKFSPDKNSKKIMTIKIENS